MSRTTIADRAPTTRTNTEPEPVELPPWKLTHPEDVCALPFCLATPVVSADGQVKRWIGRHRWRVSPLSTDWGVAVETGVAVEVDDDPDRVFVHVRLVDMDADGDDPGQSFELELTPSEAEALAASLTRSADDVRIILERRERDKAEGGAR